MGTIAPQFWDDDKVFQLDGVGVLLFNCMISGPQITNLPGLYRAEPSTFFHPLRCFPRPEVENAFGAILGLGLAIFDATSKLLRLPKCYRHHPVPNANMIIGWRKTWDKLPNAQLKFDHMDSLWRLARQKPAAAEAYVAHFGQIRPGVDPAEYRAAGWVPAIRANGTTLGRVTTLPTSPASERNTDHLFVSRDPEEKTGTGTKTGTETRTGTETSTLLQPLEDLDALEDLEPLEPYEGLEVLPHAGPGNGRRAGERKPPRTSTSAAKLDPQEHAGGSPPGDPGGVPEGDPDGGRGELLDHPAVYKSVRIGRVTLD